jgi:hypothetical protein
LRLTPVSLFFVLSKGALKKLVLDRTKPTALIVAEHIITFAKSGDLSESVGRRRSIVPAGVSTAVI